jgi:hypothetical protein
MAQVKVVIAGGTSICRSISFVATLEFELFELTEFHRDIDWRSM